MTTHSACFHPGTCWFYMEYEPLASQVLLLISDEGIGGMGPGVRVSWPPSGFPVTSWPPFQLVWPGLETHFMPPGCPVPQHLPSPCSAEPQPVWTSLPFLWTTSPFSWAFLLPAWATPGALSGLAIPEGTHSLWVL